MSGTIGYVAGGVTFGSDFQINSLSKSKRRCSRWFKSREIDLLSGGLMGDLASLIDRPFRNTISELLINDPYLQRIGAILGLVSPRNNGVYLTRSDGWESDGTDLWIGGYA